MEQNGKGLIRNKKLTKKIYGNSEQEHGHSNGERAGLACTNRGARLAWRLHGQDRRLLGASFILSELGKWEALSFYNRRLSGSLDKLGQAVLGVSIGTDEENFLRRPCFCLYGYIGTFERSFFTELALLKSLTFGSPATPVMSG